MKNSPFIMVVDDDEEILSMVSQALEQEGYDVATALDGNTALDMVRERQPDLMLLDFSMPKLDGFEILRLMRQQFNFPIIMLTGIVEPTKVDAALTIGADDYIKKPFALREMVARIEAKLRRVRWQQANNEEGSLV